jgi:hypothetical protein
VYDRGVRGALLAVVGCSTPASPQAPTAPVHDAAVATVPPDADARFHYDWQAARDLGDDVREPHSYPSCGLHHHGRDILRNKDHEIVCLPEDWPDDVAGQINFVETQDLDHTQIVIDRGTYDGVGLDWQAAILDDRGYLVFGWQLYLPTVGDHHTAVIVGVGRGVARVGAHVVLRKAKHR